MTSTNTTDSPGEWAESLPTWGGECCCHTPRRVTTEHVCSTPGILHLGPPRGREQQWMKGLTLPTTIWSSFWMKEAGMGRSAWSWGGWEGEAGMGRSAWSSDSKSLLYGPFSHQTSLGPYNFEQLIKDF